jgi:hypothetical protein
MLSTRAVYLGFSIFSTMQMAAPHPGRGGRARRCSAASLLIGCQPSASFGWPWRSPASPLWGRFPGGRRWPATTPTQFSVCADGRAALAVRNCWTRRRPIGLLSHEHGLVPLVVRRVGRPCRRLVGRGDSHAGSNSAGASRTAFRSYRDPGRIGVRPDDEGASQPSRATAHPEFPAVCDPASRIPVAARFGRAAHRRAAFSLLATGGSGQASKPQIGLETCCSVAFGA